LYPHTTAFRASAFTLRRDFDPTELPTVHLEQNYEDSSQQKREVPTADGSSIEATLYVMKASSTELQQSSILTPHWNFLITFAAF
jgi:hypothetical protein